MLYCFNFCPFVITNTRPMLTACECAMRFNFVEKTEFFFRFRKLYVKNIV